MPAPTLLRPPGPLIPPLTVKRLPAALMSNEAANPFVAVIGRGVPLKAVPVICRVPPPKVQTDARLAQRGVGADA